MRTGAQDTPEGCGHFVRTPLFVPSSPPVAVGGGCPASPCPCATPPDGGVREGEAKKAPALYHGQRTAKRLPVESGTPLPHHSSTSVRACQAPFWGAPHHLPQTGCPGKGGLWPLVLTLAWTAWMWYLFLRGAAADLRRAQPAPAAPRREEVRRPMALAGPPDRGRQEGEPARRGWGAGTNGATKGEHPRSGPTEPRGAKAEHSADVPPSHGRRNNRGRPPRWGAGHGSMLSRYCQAPILDIGTVFRHAPAQCQTSISTL